MKVREVIIYGDKYRLRTDEDDELVKEVADYLNTKMREVEKHSNILTTSKIAVLTAFNITADYIKLKNELENSNKIIDELNSKLEVIQA
ncbi:MAG: cell division protein ZapA [Deferribacterota bacterium]|nr:cell division protein ZapA [Deferribacterota bacterium]